MKLTISEIQHVSDLQYPIGPNDCPIQFVTGSRETLWAEDEHGRTWMKEPSDDRWRCCVTVKTVGYGGGADA